jgi:MoaD family protein
VAVTVKVPPQLRPATGGASAVQASGATVGEVLEQVFARHEELRERITGEDGVSVRRFVNVYVDGEDMRFLDGLATPVRDGAEVQVLPAVAGG